MSYVAPAYAFPPPPILTPFGRLSYGADAVAFAGGFTGASAVWPTANTAYFFPFKIEYPDTARKMYVENGTVAAGNVDVGIYDVAGNRLVSIGTGVAQTGTSVTQVFDIADTYLATGRYYMAMACSLGTATVIRAAGNIEMEKATGAQQMASAYPLPATATFAVVTTAHVPFFGISFRTSVP